MGVKPMSPRASFGSDAFGHHAYAIPRPKGSSSLLRFFLCSRPCFQHSVDVDDSGTDVAHGSGDVDCHLLLELQAAMRHLEVRWQLFDEALSRFGDLEAMLAICADEVRWRHHSPSGVTDANVCEDLKSLVSRKLSMEVSIARVTQMSPDGELGASFDRDGHWGQQLQARDSTPVQAALDFFYQSRSENGMDSLRSSRRCVLEEDNYSLCNKRGEVVEEGKQVVLWEQYNATWYIRGCVSYPATAKLQS